MSTEVGEMTSKVKFLVALLVVLSAPVVACGGGAEETTGSVVYSNVAYRYSIIHPQGWKPDVVVPARVHVVNEKDPRDRVSIFARPVSLNLEEHFELFEDAWRLAGFEDLVTTNVSDITTSQEIPARRAVWTASATGIALKGDLLVLSSEDANFTIVSVTRERSYDSFASIFCAMIESFTVTASASTTSLPPISGRIAFESRRDGNGEIYVMSADGSGQINLTNDHGTDFSPSWSPDGASIAFVSLRGSNADIYVMSADGSGQTNLTNDPGDDLLPAWSPDGARIAFVSDRDGNEEIYVMSADGSGQTNLTNDPAADWAPSWSPDGARIAFYSKRDGNWEIYFMSADGSGQTNLTNNPAIDGEPSWGP